MVGAGVTPSAPRAGLKSRSRRAGSLGGLLGPLLPHPTHSLHLVALRPGAGDSQRVHVFPRRIPNGKQGGGRAGDVRFWSKSLPPTTGDTSTGGDELSPPLQAAGAASPPRWFFGSVCGEAGAAPGAHLPFRNIIPGQFRLPEGEGAAGRGGDENRGHRFQPGSSSPTQRLPRTARGGGWTEGCAVYPEGCMSRGNGPPRSQIF